MIPGLLAAIAVFSYLLGGLNGAIIASKYVFHRDVRDYGSSNAGLTNFFRTFGAPGLAIVIGTDVLKTVIAVVAGGLIMGTQGAAATGQVFAGFLCHARPHLPGVLRLSRRQRVCSAPRPCS